MTGILDGVRVLDLTRGIAGPIAGMLLADYGADVVRIEPPDGDPWASQSGYVVWNRGKRRTALNLKERNGHAAFLELAASADVVIESYRPGVTSRLGVDYESVRARNPRLVYCSITGYGRGNAHSDRPGIEWLVTARMGLGWDQRGYYGTLMDHIMGTEAAVSSFEVPAGAEQTGCREGPIFLAVPWASLSAAILAVTATSAALYVRERTGQGQLVETSLAQGAIAANHMGWQRVETVHPSYRLWYFDRRGPKGIFQCADGQWLHQWAPIDHEFIRATAAHGGMPVEVSSLSRSARYGGELDYERDVEHQARQYAGSAEAMLTLPRDTWIRAFADSGRPAQPIRSPEEALFDEPLMKEGVIVEVNDPVHGHIRQVGHTYSLDAVPSPRIRARAAAVEPATTILPSWPEPNGEKSLGQSLPPAPLAGVVVLDFGLAVAGPYGPQLLADLGATVIKVTALDFSLTNAIYVGSSRGKLAISVDMKHPRGLEVARRLIQNADVVHHNMRSGVAERLGIGYAQAKEVNPAIIYCHTRGFEKDGPRTHLPGNDQMGNALAGSEYEGGGTHLGTPPIWHVTGFGDTATGMLSANAVIQALLHRERTGEGQFCHASIVNSAMLFNSSTFAYPDGSGPNRERIDAQQFGFSAVRRLYETADGWLSLYVRHDADWAALHGIVDPALGGDHRFCDTAARAANDTALATHLEACFRTISAADWFDRLDAAGIPCEIASKSYAREFLDDAEMHERGWVVTNPHRHLGSVTQSSTPFTFSATPARNLAGAPVTGQHTREILDGLGYSELEIQSLLEDHVVGDEQASGVVGT